MSATFARFRAVTKQSSPLLVFIAYRQHRGEGEECARWLNTNLKGRQMSFEAGQTTTIGTYLAEHAPAIGDWTQKWKGDLRTARAMILVCSKTTALRRGKLDWLHDEIDWWQKNRRTTAPIVVLSGDVDASTIPIAFRQRYPNLQWLTWSETSSEAEQALLIERITEGIKLSERGVNYAELRRLQILNRSLLSATAVALILGALAFFFARSQREQRRIAERNLQLSYGPTLQVAMGAYRQTDYRQVKDLLLGVQPQLRGFEWRLLRHLTDQSERTWVEQENVHDFEYSPDGKYLVVGKANGKLLIQSLKTMARDREIEADHGLVTVHEVVPGTYGGTLQETAPPPNLSKIVFFGPTRLATVGSEAKVHLWDLNWGGGPLQEILKSPIESPRSTLAVNSTGYLLASGTDPGYREFIGEDNTVHEDGIVHVWQIASGPPSGFFSARQDPIATLKVGTEPVALAFSPDSKLLVVAAPTVYVQRDYSPYIQVWDWQAQKKVGVLDSDQDVRSLTLLGGVLYGGRGDGSIVTWDLTTRKPQVVLPADGDRGSITQLRPSPDGKRLAGVTGRRIFIWEPATNAMRWLAGAEDDVASVRFRPEPYVNMLVSASGKKMRFYDLEAAGPHGPS